MSYQVLYTRRAERDIDGLDVDVRRRIGKKILAMSSDPFHYAERLVAPEIGTYRFRIGDYRVVFDVHEESIVILRIGHRREIYRR